MSATCEVRHYRPGDEKGIAALFKEVFGKELSLGQWRWKYLVPADGKVLAKVATTPAGAIVGHAGAVPLRGIHRGSHSQFCQIADVMVRSEARGYLGRSNVFGHLVRSLLEDARSRFGQVFGYGFPGQRPFMLGERLGVYESICNASTLGRTLTKPRIEVFRRYTVEALPWSDARLDGLWHEISPRLGLAVARDSAYLNWRYRTNPFFPYRLLGIFRRRSLSGWAVARDAGSETLVVDLLVKRTEATEALRTLQRYLSRAGTETMRLWLPARWSSACTDCSVTDSEVVVTNMVWRLPIPTSVPKRELYYTMGDADIF
jgi:hypothetical protein